MDDGMDIFFVFVVHASVLCSHPKLFSALLICIIHIAIVRLMIAHTRADPNVAFYIVAVHVSFLMIRMSMSMMLYMYYVLNINILVIVIQLFPLVVDVAIDIPSMTSTSITSCAQNGNATIRHGKKVACGGGDAKVRHDTDMTVC
jgi:hypothetical protein